MSHATTKPDSPIWLLPYHSDPIAYLCKQIVSEYKKDLPDLTHITILMSNTHAATRLRQTLTHEADQAGFPALLGPKIQSLANFIDDTQTCNMLETIPTATRELMLVDALRDYPDLYGKSSPWLLAENLLQLFDELSQQQTVLPDNIDEFTEDIIEAYGIPKADSDDIEAQLSHEAKLVHTLWKAWQQQLTDENKNDRHQRYIEKLANYSHHDGQQLILLGYTDFIPAEQQWFHSLAKQGNATLILQGEYISTENHYHPNTAIKRLLDENSEFISEPSPITERFEQVLNDIYTHNETDISSRASTISTQHIDSPLEDKLSIFSANTAEQEVLAIELQIRDWLHEGKRNIGVVTQDRRLARRLRALLERTNIELRDYSGWTLSTTSAAAALERWLECIEQDFNHLPLLDLLKSSFTFSSLDKEDKLYHIYRFEQDIILHENIAENIYRYKKQIDRRTSRIDEIWTKDISNALHELLDSLNSAAKPLKNLQQGKHSPIDFLDALLQSMEQIEMDIGLSKDVAGQRVLDEINSMRLSLTEQEFSINWSEFRYWLGRTLERYNFVPPASSSQVQLLDINSSLLCQFEALVIAAADTEHLPGRTTQAAFFNDAVRYSLKLKTATDNSINLFYHFRCLLHAAPKILLSYTKDNNGNTNLASPWLECLRHYHHIAWGSILEPVRLTQWLNENYTGHRKEDNAVTPAPINANTTTICDIDLLPSELSASSYQQLIDCPYQFFSARCLGLKATDEIRLVLEKSDYGSRVHRCLQAFHEDIENLPGPFTETINKANKAAAISCLTDISFHVFSYDLEDNFQHRGWSQTWRQLIPMYIDWQINHNITWKVRNTEKMLSNELNNNFTLKGVLDRTDISPDGIGIIDYKTGLPPSKKDIHSGEAVQLPFYALLLSETVNQVEYLMLNDNKVKTTGILKQEELHELMQLHTKRLATLFAQLNSDAILPAWGDSKSCSYCEMDGICRRDAWEVSQ